MNRDVMMEPTQEGKVVGVVGAAPGAFCDVVWLQPVATLAPVDGANTLIPVPDRGPDGGRDSFSQIGGGEGVALSVFNDHPDLTGAQDLGQQVGSRPGARDNLTPASPLVAAAR